MFCNFLHIHYRYFSQKLYNFFFFTKLFVSFQPTVSHFALSRRELDFIYEIVIL